MNSLFKRRKVPKEFLQPRPMSNGPQRGNRLWGYLLVEVIAVLCGTLVAVFSLAAPLDFLWLEQVTRYTARSAPPHSVALVEVSHAAARSEQCGERLSRALTTSGARAGLVLEPLSSLCEGVFHTSSLESESAPPLAELPTSVFRAGSSAVPVGFEPSAATNDLLSALGVAVQPWVAARQLSSVPRLELDQLLAGDSENRLLADRIAVVALEGSAPARGYSPRGITALLGSALEDRPKPPTPWWIVAALAAALSLAVVLVTRRVSEERQLRIAVLVCCGALGAMAATDLLGIGLLLPLPSLALCASATGFVLVLPRRVAGARAEKHAEQLLQGAGRLLNVRANDEGEGEFWARLARTAAQAHAADDVLVAELPPFSWRLKVWPNGDTDESIIRERRRDIRRTPYSNLQGVPVASVVHDYLVMKGTPAVLIPLIASEEVEGYLILVGHSAVDEFKHRPKLAEGLTKELGQLIREFRLARLKNQQWRRPGGLSDVPVARDANVLERARAAMEELKLLSEVVQSCPIGIFFVDSFGDVRILGRAVARWLPELGIELPAQGLDGSVDAGVLSLKRLLSSLARKTHQEPPAFTEIGSDGYRLEIPVSPKPGRKVKSLELRLQPLKKGGWDGQGFVGTLSESALRTASMAPRPSIMEQTESSLQVFSLSTLLAKIAADASHQAERQVRLQSPRAEAHVIAHRAQLEGALLSFLTSAAKNSGKDEGPVLVVSQDQQRVVLQVMDLRLDAPPAALQRTVLAPSSPPAGLRELAELVSAVENSHGDVRLETDAGWGTQLVISMVRARPRVTASEARVPDLRLYNKPVKIV